MEPDVRPGGRTGPGRLKVFLGAAPGVGKTYRMLEEGSRRAERGTDVVVAFAECHGRPHTEEKLGGLEILPRAPRTHGDGIVGEMDLDAVLVRRPEVALIDDLAHTNLPGGRNAKRRQDVEELLAAGIDVVTTLNIQHLESLNNVVEEITKVPERETVPDGVVRRAWQIELVDMPVEALRRRVAHGDVYAPESVDAAMASYFRIGNLTALRELALLWVAGRVDEALRTYRSEHGIGGVRETRERVVVALSGGPEGETIIRRAARIAARSAGCDLLAVHVTRSDGLAGGSSPEALAGQRALVESLGGSYHSVVGDDVPTALLEFARAENATQLVLGTSSRGRLERFLTGRGIGETVVARSGNIDAHMVTHERAGRGSLLLPRRRTLSTSRLVAGPVSGLVLPVALAFLLDHARGTLNVTSEALLFLLTVVGVACVGGVVSAVVASVTASLLLNYWFMPPVGEFTTSLDSVLATAVFAVVAGTVAAVVDRSLRLSRRAARATAEAETLSSLAGSIVRGDQAVPALLERMRETFGMDSAELVEVPATDEQVWGEPVAAVDRGGGGAAEAPVVRMPVGQDACLVLRGRTLPASDRRVLAAFAAHIAVALERTRLAEAAAEIEPVRAADRMRTALLAAVSHDLRTPLAAGWAAVSSLRSQDVDFSDQDRDELLATAEESMARLGRLIDNLLDMSRLQAGALTLGLRATTWEEVLPAALESLPADAPAVDVRSLEGAPAVLADPPLLEQVVANLLSNAARYTPEGQRVVLTAGALADHVEFRVVDRGPGLPAEEHELAFVPFQRLGDTDNTTGVGLGLALARGLTEAMGGTLTPEDTPGGGLTMVLRLPAARSSTAAPKPSAGEDRPGEAASRNGASRNGRRTQDAPGPGRHQAPGTPLRGDR